MLYNSKIHHRKSIRLKYYDYSQPGFYFITICTKDKTCLFGKIVDGRGAMHCALNKYGEIAQNEWYKTEQIRQNISLDAFVVMLNHIHGIIVINNRRGTMHRAPTIERFGIPTINSIPTIIRSYKASVTKQINELRNRPVPVWQRNFYEHVIRSDESLDKIREYIINNPVNWENDELFVN